MKTINVNLPVEAVSVMLTNKLKQDKDFGVFLVNSLNASYTLDFIIDVMQNGIPKQEFAIGENVLSTEEYSTGKDDDGNYIYKEIGACTVKEYRPYERHNQYTVECIDGKDEASSRWVSKDKLKHIPE